MEVSICLCWYQIALKLAANREEQHDDQMLYELLRCIKALSTSEVRLFFYNPLASS